MVFTAIIEQACNGMRMRGCDVLGGLFCSMITRCASAIGDSPTRLEEAIFYQELSSRKMSVCLSVCHTPVFCRNG